MLPCLRCPLLPPPSGRVAERDLGSPKSTAKPGGGELPPRVQDVKTRGLILILKELHAERGLPRYGA